MANIAASPLRYPGGKSCLYNIVKSIIQNNMAGHVKGYAEPFAGGCGLALQLLFDDIVQKIYLNDIDRNIWSFWHSILNDTEAFIEKIENTTVSIEQWHKQRDIYRSEDHVPTLELGFATFFLNRTNRSGIIKGGVIGGIKQDGNYKLDCRFNKKALIERILKVISFKNKIEFHNKDAIEFLDTIENSQNNILLCIDPPYYNKGSSLYTSFYKHNDHVDLGKKISKVKKPWIITYDNVEEIKKIYKPFRQFEFNLNYSAQMKKVAKEVLISSHNLNITSSPAESDGKQNKYVLYAA